MLENEYSWFLAILARMADLEGESGSLGGSFAFGIGLDLLGSRGLVCDYSNEELRSMGRTNDSWGGSNSLCRRSQADVGVY